MKLSKEENDLLLAIESGEWKSAEANLEEYKKAANNHLKKNQRISIRISEYDLRSVQKRTIAEGMPYQSLITSLIHKYLTGKLVEAK